MIGRNDECWCGSKKKWKKCHYPAVSPHETSQEALAEKYFKKYRILLKTPEEIKGIRAACQLAATVLKKTCDRAKAGVTTNELNAFADEQLRKAGAISACLHYGQPPFPKSICTSLNDVICHGIPDDVPLKEGDILNIDVSCILKEYYGDCSAMVMIGEVPSNKKLVVDVAYECLMRSIAILRPGVPLYKIGDAIEDYATSKGCSVVDQFVGHGVGVDFHEPPQVPHHRNQVQIPLAAGMTFTIEPMINAGVKEGVFDRSNGWVVRTKDGKPSAQWEHTLLITDSGVEILTLPEL